MVKSPSKRSRRSDCLTFLNDKFRGRVISRRDEIPWPSYSPDLSPLDYYFWGFANAEVWRQQPATLEQLKRIVEEVAASLSGDVLRAVMAYFRKRCEVCLAMEGISSSPWSDFKSCVIPDKTSMNSESDYIFIIMIG